MISSLHEPSKVIQGGFQQKSNTVVDPEKLKPNANIYPDRDLLKQIRLKYGIVTIDDPTSKENTWTENIRLIDINDEQQSKMKEYSLRNANDIQNKMHKVQHNVRRQLAKLPSTGESSAIIAKSKQPDVINIENTSSPKVCQCCLKVCRPASSLVKNDDQQSTIPVSSGLMEFFQNQNKQLQDINEKISKLLTLHQQPSTKVLTTRIEQIMENDDEMTDSDANSGINYLDSSIEKVRRNLLESVESTARKTVNKEVQKRSPKENENNESQRLFTNILSEVNSILVRNGSCCSTSSETTTGSGDGRRSSCSITPDTSGDKIFKQNSHKHFRQKHPRQLLRTEQSIYIQRLASKYRINDNESSENEPELLNQELNSIVLESVQKAKRLDNRNVRKHDCNENTCQATNFNRFRTDFNRYALSDHNSSIATRQYLDKYGLTMATNDDGPQSMFRCNQKKTPLNSTINQDDSDLALFRSKQTIEQKFKKKRDNNVQKPKTNQTKVKIRPNHCPELDFSSQQLIDLHAIRRLPKLK